MTDLATQLKNARGQEYYRILKIILLQTPVGQQIIDDAKALGRARKLTPVTIGVLTIKYNLNYRMVCEWVEERGVMARGTHEQIMRSGHRVKDILALAQKATDAGGLPIELTRAPEVVK